MNLKSLVFILGTPNEVNKEIAEHLRKDGLYYLWGSTSEGEKVTDETETKVQVTGWMGGTVLVNCQYESPPPTYQPVMGMVVGSVEEVKFFVEEYSKETNVFEISRTVSEQEYAIHG